MTPKQAILATLLFGCCCWQCYFLGAMATMQQVQGVQRQALDAQVEATRRERLAGELIRELRQLLAPEPLEERRRARERSILRPEPEDAKPRAAPGPLKRVLARNRGVEDSV